MTINSISSLSLFSREWGQGCKFQAPNHDLVFLVTSLHLGASQEPTQSCLIRTKDNPITQEMTWVLGALCQEPGKRPRYIFFYYLTVSMSHMLLHAGVVWGSIDYNFVLTGFPGGAVVENLPANAGDTGSSPGLGRSHMPRSN